MNRRLALSLAVVTAAAVGTTPALAAKPKPKPIKGSYALNLRPGPVQDVTNLSPTAADPTGCDKTVPGSYDEHAFSVPAAGTLQVTLDSPDPTGAPSVPVFDQVGTDWDLWIQDADGVVDAAHGPTSHEQTTTKFKKGDKVLFQVCNVAGGPSGTVTYTFTYK